METIEKQVCNLGFIGLGWIGRNRMEKLLKNKSMSCKGIIEPHPENLKQAQLLAPEAQAYLSLNQLFEVPEIDGIVIATPNAFHELQATAAFAAGKAVFCQKPLGRNSAEVKRVIEAAKKADKPLGVDLSYRYTKAFQSIYKLIQKGEIGEIYAVNMVFHNAYGPDKEWFYDFDKSGGGCVLDLGIHLIDLALWTLNFPEIETLDANLYKNGERLESAGTVVEDYASVFMTTNRGTTLNMQCSWNISAGRDAVIELQFFGTKGGASFRNVNGSFYDFTAEKYLGTHAQILVAPPDDWGGGALKAWAEKVAHNHPFDEQTAKEQLILTEIIERIYER